MNEIRTSKVIPLSAAGRSSDRLDSWKEIAAYLKRGARTVQRWEREQGLPVHRLQHDKLGSIYAFRHELDLWWNSREPELANEPKAQTNPAPSIAVLPFEDVSQAKDQEYFCEGLAAEIINALSRISGLRVTSRTSSFQFRAGASDSRDIGKRLKVNALLEGSVRKAGNRLRVTVQLINTENAFQLWADRYDRDISDVFAIQDEIAQNIVHALEVTLNPREHAQFGTPPTCDVRAFDCYLRARKFYYRYGPDDMQLAVQLFERALELDPNYAQACAGLADCWSYIYLYSDRSEEVLKKANEASRKAVEMDAQSAQAHASLALSISLSGHDAEAEAEFERAIHLDPGLYEAYYFYARHSFARGRLEKAVGLYEKAMLVRPEDHQAPLLAAQSYEVLGRLAEAEAARRRGVALAEQHVRSNPGDVRAIYMAANGLVALGEVERGREWANLALTIRPDDSMLLYNVGCILSMLGDTGPSIDCLEKAVARGLTQKGWYEHDSNLDHVCSHPRFQKLLESLSG